MFFDWIHGAAERKADGGWQKYGHFLLRLIWRSQAPLDAGNYETGNDRDKAEIL